MNRLSPNRPYEKKWILCDKKRLAQLAQKNWRKMNLDTCQNPKKVQEKIILDAWQRCRIHHSSDEMIIAELYKEDVESWK